MTDKQTPAPRAETKAPAPKADAATPAAPLTKKIEQIISGQFIQGLPNAAIIYAVAASAIFAVGILTIIGGHWISGLIILATAACLFGYALVYMKN